MPASNVPACYKSKSYNVHTMCLLVTDVPYNVPACCLLVTKSFTNELNACQQLSPCLSPSIPMLINKVSLKNKVHVHILVLICLLNAAEVTKLS